MANKLSTGLRNKLLGINIDKLGGYGSFTSDVSGWTAVNNAATYPQSVAGGQSGNCVKIVSNGGAAAGQIYRDVTVNIGHKYEIDVYHKNGAVGTATGKFRVGKTTDDDYYYLSPALTDTTWTDQGATTFDQPYKVIIVPEETTIRITLETAGTTLNDETLFDEVKVFSLSKNFQDIFYKGFMDLYEGSMPSSPDNAPGTVKLVRLYSDGLAIGLTFDDSVAGVLYKKSTETWSGVGITSGTIGWYRIVAPGDSGSSSTTEERFDGDVSTLGASINLSALTVQSAVPITLSTYSVTLPGS